MKKIISVLILCTLLIAAVGCDNGLSLPDKAKVVSLSASPSAVHMYTGQKTEFNLEATMSNGEIVDLASSNNFSYTVSKENAINIDSGFIKATDKVADTSLIVTFSSGDITDSINISIKENPITAFHVTDEGDSVVNDADRLDVIVNKSLHLSSLYIPADLVIPNITFPSSYKGELEKMYMRQDAANALEEMFADAKEEGIELYAISGYRSYGLQDRIFKYQVGRHNGSEEEANKISAKPGQSEHQTGLAMDISCKASGYKLIDTFETTAEGVWLKENSAKYGFILRYMKGKEDITGYSYEPWHFRYVGVDLATKIMESEMTLEEYFNSIN